MKRKNKANLDDELRSEYDFSQLKDGIKGKYTKKYRAGTNLTLLAPDVAKAFPTDESVNDVLRQLIKIAKKSKPVSLK